MKKLSRILVLGLLCITLSTCDMITYFDCKRTMIKGGEYPSDAAAACKGN